MGGCKRFWHLQHSMRHNKSANEQAGNAPPKEEPLQRETSKRDASETGAHITRTKNAECQDNLLNPSSMHPSWLPSFSVPPQGPFLPPQSGTIPASCIPLYFPTCGTHCGISSKTDNYFKARWAHRWYNFWLSQNWVLHFLT